MSKYWKPSRNGKEDFEEIYYKYKSKQMSQTECAYHLGISIMGFYKRCKYYENNLTTNYDTTSMIVKKEAAELMEKHINKIKKFNIKYQEGLTDVLYRTCKYIIIHKNEIKDEEKLIYFSLKRKIRDLKFEEIKKREKIIYDEECYQNKFGDICR